ncbi:MAG: ABC transporter permease [Chloroflexi bacterium]|nr:ABC transporter permease [Chloroflexota bacterium]
MTTIPILISLSLLVFFLIHLVPGSIAAVILDQDATPERIEALETELGLNDPLVQQYTRWFTGVLQGDLGASLINGQPVLEALGERIAVTIYIALGGMIVAVLLGVSTGILAALYPHSWLDRGVTIITGFSSALPSYFIAMLLVIVFAVQRDWFPTVGYTPPHENLGEWLQSITLPSIALGLPSAALISRQTRSAMLGVMQSAYIRAAYASGLPVGTIIFSHAMPNALIPGVTSIGHRFSITLGIAFVVEQVFALPGLGSLLARAVLNQDITIVQGGVLAIGIIIIIVNTLVDLSYAQLNPKVRLG